MHTCTIVAYMSVHSALVIVGAVHKVCQARGGRRPRRYEDTCMTVCDRGGHNWSKYRDVLYGRRKAIQRII